MNITLPGAAQSVASAGASSGASLGDRTQPPVSRQSVSEPSGTRGETSRGDLDSAVASMQSFVQAIQRDLNFKIDDESGRVVVSVIAADSGEVIRQIPSEEALELAARFDDMRSLLFRERA